MCWLLPNHDLDEFGYKKCFRGLNHRTEHRNVGLKDVHCERLRFIYAMVNITTITTVNRRETFQRLTRSGISFHTVLDVQVSFSNGTTWQELSVDYLLPSEVTSAGLL
jgi:hypothetical protein